MSASETTAMENNFLNSNKRYIEEVIEDSDAIADVHNDILNNKQTEKDNHRYAMEHITDVINDIRDESSREIDSLKNEIDDLKQMIEELTK